MSAGSSPPARGTHGERLVGRLVLRFIPARAGNTQEMRRPSGPHPVHPRPRGEHQEGQVAYILQHGSSPPARGTPPHGIRPRSKHRFIPARAGNTKRVKWPTSSNTVHPRPRGEHHHMASAHEVNTGSSPPARGTRFLAVEVYAVARFIPARAGNTPPRPSLGCAWSVHPRPRGEHQRLLKPEVKSSGSSPPARGTRSYEWMPLSVIRFIPARAGNTAAVSLSNMTDPVHPRPRGEHGSSSDQRF